MDTKNWDSRSWQKSEPNKKRKGKEGRRKQRQLVETMRKIRERKGLKVCPKCRRTMHKRTLMCQRCGFNFNVRNEL